VFEVNFKMPEKIMHNGLEVALDCA